MVGTNNYKRVIGMTILALFLLLGHSLTFAGEVVASLTFSEKNFNIYKMEQEWRGKFWHKVKWENPELIEVKPSKPKEVSNFLYIGREPCKPALPRMIIEVAIPWGNKVTNVEVLSKDSLVLSGRYDIIPQWHLRLKLLPRPGEPKPKEPEDFPDSVVYASNSPYPGRLVEFHEAYETGGPCVAYFFVYPLQYIPIDKKLILYTRIEFRATYAPKEDIESLPRFIDTEELKSIKEKVINPEDVHIQEEEKGSSLFMLPPDKIPYAIITTNEFSSYFTDLRDWRRRKGFYDTLVTTEAINSKYSGADL